MPTFGNLKFVNAVIEIHLILIYLDTLLSSFSNHIFSYFAPFSVKEK